jgi:hypothetical protein
VKLLGAVDGSLREYVRRVRDEATAAERLAEKPRQVTPRRLDVPPLPMAPCPFCQAMPDSVETSERFKSKVADRALTKRTCSCGTLTVWR